jgi:hypothetical protein
MILDRRMCFQRLMTFLAPAAEFSCISHVGCKGWVLNCAGSHVDDQNLLCPCEQAS